MEVRLCSISATFIVCSVSHVSATLHFSDVKLAFFKSVASLTLEALCESNKRVMSLSTETDEAGPAPKRTKITYSSYSTEDLACIGRYAAEHGLTKALAFHGPRIYCLTTEETVLGKVKQSAPEQCRDYRGDLSSHKSAWPSTFAWKYSGCSGERVCQCTMRYIGSGKYYHSVGCCRRNCFCCRPQSSKTAWWLTSAH